VVEDEEEQMNFLSVFSGIGGFDLALESTGMNCVGMCEIDKSCQSLLHRHFPQVAIYNDVKEIGVNTHERGSVDLICGGFPCQDLSIAGKRAGLAGERSGLWFEFARVIDELEPRWVIIENVPGLLSSNKGKDFAVIVRWLAERGYGVAWRILDAQYFGVPQRRRRVFIVASLGNGRAAEVLFEREGVSGDTPKSRKAGEETPAATLRGFGHGWQGQHNDTNALMVAHETGQGYWQDGDISGTLRSEGENRPSRPSNVICMSSGQANAEIVKDGSPSLTQLHEQPIVMAFRPNNSAKARSMGIGVDVSPTLPSEDSGNKVCIANWQSGGGKMDDGVAASLRSGAEHSAQFLWEMSHASEAVRESGDISPTLQQRMGTGGNQVPLVGIRRLTPLECERLQGFPDGWTDGQSDSIRYRQLGNAVAVPVVEWIARRIVQTS
jgi:DNA (cytosine-5)-methyltransferase 1